MTAFGWHFTSFFGRRPLRFLHRCSLFSPHIPNYFIARSCKPSINIVLENGERKWPKIGNVILAKFASFNIISKNVKYGHTCFYKTVLDFQKRQKCILGFSWKSILFKMFLFKVLYHLITSNEHFLKYLFNQSQQSQTFCCTRNSITSITKFWKSITSITINHKKKSTCFFQSQRKF